MNLETDLEKLSPRPKEYLVLYFGMEWYFKRACKYIDMKQKVKEVDPEIEYKLLRDFIGMGIIYGIEILGLYYLISQLTN